MEIKIIDLNAIQRRKTGSSEMNSTTENSGMSRKTKISALEFSIILFGIINGALISRLFVHQVYYILLVFVFPVLCVMYIASLTFAIIEKGKDKKKAIIISLLTPLVAFLLIVSNLPIYFNFVMLYPYRTGVAVCAKLIDDSSPIWYNNVLCTNGIDVSCTEDDEVVYFKIREEFLMSNDFPDNVYVEAANSGFEYSKNGFNNLDSGYYDYVEEVIYFGQNWRYVSYERIEYNY